MRPPSSLHASAAMSRHERPKAAVLSKSTRRDTSSVSPSSVDSGKPLAGTRTILRPTGTTCSWSASIAHEQDGLASPNGRNRNPRGRETRGWRVSRGGHRRRAWPRRAARHRGAAPPRAGVCRRLRLDRRGAHGKPSPRTVFWQFDLHLGVADRIDPGIPRARVFSRGTTRRPATGAGRAVRGRPRLPRLRSG